MITTYEERLNRDLRWALDEGSMHFDENNAVHRALRRITARLTELGIPHAVVGGMAMFFHGFRRFTEDVDILVTPESLKEIHAKLAGPDYALPVEGSKHLRDTELGVRIKFLATGSFPGDGKPRSIAFPDPADFVVDLDGVPCITLPKLIELKLASGISGAARLRDLGDVQQIISTLKLSRGFSNQLDPSLRAKYEELWDGVQQSSTLE